MMVIYASPYQQYIIIRKVPHAFIRVDANSILRSILPDFRSPSDFFFDQDSCLCQSIPFLQTQGFFLVKGSLLSNKAA